ncbi:hypothetical protein NE398_17675 [Clostridium tertium]|uniref:Uncharacterized protein n=1 Tax=Clostridium tertium TaxID=1559 RepID=A0A9X3XRV6_9CLOT|nr:hypothetical protein [Clostridium tertium]MDC4241967.1 hypothetical protein [Clostridium tertium]
MDNVKLLEVLLMKTELGRETILKLNGAIAGKITENQNEIIVEKSKELVSYIFECVGIRR